MLQNMIKNASFGLTRTLLLMNMVCYSTSLQILYYLKCNKLVYIHWPLNLSALASVELYFKNVHRTPFMSYIVPFFLTPYKNKEYT
jgi:hypothetical protein